MRRTASTILILAVSLTGSSCASTGEEDGERRAITRRAAVISRAEILDAQVLTAHDAVRELRPLWLNPRGPDLISFGGRVGARVAIDNVIRGAMDELMGIRIHSIQEIRFISGSDATTRWGSGVQGGVIEVITLKTER